MGTWQWLLLLLLHCQYIEVRAAVSFAVPLGNATSTDMPRRLWAAHTHNDSIKLIIQVLSP